MKIPINDKEELNPDFWQNGVLNRDIRIALLKIASTFLKDSKLKVTLKDVYFLGSNANYNWTDQSDIDLHILIDFKELNMPYDDARNYANVLAKKWNNDHDITVRNKHVEVYLQDVQEENKSVGVYSIISNKWIKQPVKLQKVEIDKNLVKLNYKKWKNIINKAIERKDVQFLEKTMSVLSKVRNNDLKLHGEYGIENLTFKLLRNTNVLKKLKNAIIINTDKELSLKESELLQSELLEFWFGKKEDVNESGHAITPDDKNLYIGFIDAESFKVKGERADVIKSKSPNTANSHSYFTKHLGYKIRDWKNEVLPWRYRKDVQTLYWWNGIPPSGYKDEVVDWIEKTTHTNVKDNVEIRADSPSFYQSHNVNL